MLMKQDRWSATNLGSIPLNYHQPITNRDMSNGVRMVSTLETKRSTEKELLHRWALMSMRFDYHKIRLPTEPEFWKKSRRRCQDKSAAQGSNALTSGYDMTWLLGGRGDQEMLGSTWRDISCSPSASELIQQNVTPILSQQHPSQPHSSLFQAQHLCGAEQSAHPHPQPP